MGKVLLAEFAHARGLRDAAHAARRHGYRLCTAPRSTSPAARWRNVEVANAIGTGHLETFGSAGTGAVAGTAA